MEVSHQYCLAVVIYTTVAFCTCPQCLKITLKLSFYNKKFKAPNPAGVSVEITFRTRILQIGVLSIFPLFLQAIF